MDTLQAALLLAVIAAVFAYFVSNTLGVIVGLIAVVLIVLSVTGSNL